MERLKVQKWIEQTIGRSVSRREQRLLDRVASLDEELWEEFSELFYVAALRLQGAEESRSGEGEIFLKALESTPQGVMITDAEKLIRWVNPSFMTTTGYRLEEVSGRTPSILQSGRHDSRYYVNMWEALDRTGHWEGEIWNRRKNGEIYPEWLSISEIRAQSGEVTNYVGIFSDITDRKLAEEALSQARDQALETSRLKSQFLANMSHEIRTPMNGIIGMSDLLLGTPLKEEQREYASIIRDSAYSLLTIINDILDFSKIEAGKMELEVIDFSLPSIVEGTAELLADKSREKKLSLMTYIDPAIPSQLRGDPGRLRQVLLNLADNAVKFTERGEVILKAELVEQDRTHVALRFSVSDTGIGLSETAKKRLFQAFVQADGTTTRKYGGTGLGLSISKRLVEMMDGEIAVESEEGKGSTFWFTVRLEPSGSKGASLAAKTNLQGIRVLVLDDSSSGEILHNYIVAWGMRNGCVRHPKEALEVLRREAAAGDPYHLLILDLSLSGLEEFSFAKILQSDPSIAATKLILITTYDTRSLGEKALGAGFSAYLTKPVKQSPLFDCIANVMNRAPSKERNKILDESLPQPSSPSVAPSSQRGRLILLAEDNPVNQRVALLQLKQLGYTAHAVANGKEALDMLARTPYALVFMDCQMPEMDGFTATKAIRKQEAISGRRVPIVAMTANAMEEDRENCIVAGMDDYISKPVNLDQLRVILEKWLPAEEVKEEALPLTINSSRLQVLCGKNKPQMLDLLHLFLSSSKSQLTQLEQAIGRRSPNEVRELAHGLKGSSAVVGAEEMERLSRELEMAAEQEWWERTEELYKEMHRSLESIRDYSQRL